MNKQVVIYQEWGGLGDNLAHSTIPYLCNEYGYDCYLSKHNKFNNPETYDLIYKNLPYIKGTVDVKDDSWLRSYKAINNNSWNHIRSIQIGYGFKEAPYSYPIINYTPKFIEELENKTLVDLSSAHYFLYFKNYFTDVNIKNIYNKIITLKDFKKIFQIKKNNYSATDSIDLNLESFSINNIFDYCDAIFSCSNFITIDSGQSNLASCIKNQFKGNKSLDIFTIGLQKNLPPVNYDSYFYLNTNHIALDTGLIIKAVDY